MSYWHILGEVIDYPKPLEELWSRIELKLPAFESNLSSKRGYQNRKKWRRGMSHCPKCQGKLTAILERGYSLRKVERILHEKHPEIQDIRKYTKNVIREVTGYGIFDDYIVARGLWRVRSPIIAPPEIHELLEAMWELNHIRGEELIKEHRALGKVLTSRSRAGQLVRLALREEKVYIPEPQEAAP